MLVAKQQFEKKKMDHEIGNFIMLNDKDNRLPISITFILLNIPFFFVFWKLNISFFSLQELRTRSPAMATMIIMFVFCFDFVCSIWEKKSLIRTNVINEFAEKKKSISSSNGRPTVFFLALIHQRPTDHLQSLQNNNVVAHEIKWSFKMILILFDYLPIQYGLVMFIVDHFRMHR